MPALYGLIGYPLTHSFSPAYFKKKFAEQNIDAVYEAFPIGNIGLLPFLLETHPDLAGLNVTKPYKELVIPYLDRLDDVAAEIGAVNCVEFKSGSKKGYNTDAVGFERSLVPMLQAQHTHALILGTGGTSKAVAYALRQLGISYRLVSRGLPPEPPNDVVGPLLGKREEVALVYSDLTAEIITGYKLIINTTSLGLYPHIDSAPSIPYEFLTPQHLLYDVIYNPEETKFLSLGKVQGVTIKNGFEMLQLQAEASWDIWQRATQIPE